MSTLNVKLGTPKFSFNLADEFRFVGELIPYILKQFEVKPSDILNRNWRLRLLGGADLDLSRSLNEQGFHIHQLSAGESEDNAPSIGIENPNINDVAADKELELFDPDDSAFEPPLQTIEFVPFP